MKSILASNKIVVYFANALLRPQEHPQGLLVDYPRGLQCYKKENRSSCDKLAVDTSHAA